MNLVKDSKMSSLIPSSTAASVFSHFSKLATVGMICDGALAIRNATDAML